MTTFESFKKFGLEYQSAMGCILMTAGAAVTGFGIIWTIVNLFTGDLGPEGIMLFLFMLLFIAPGLVLIIIGRKKFLKDKVRVDGLREAYENNRCIMADIVDIMKTTTSDKTSDNMFTGVRYREYYNIECHYKDPAGVTHVYYSPALYFDPTGLVVAKQVPVYIDKNDENNFYVDIYKALAPMKIH